MFTVEFAYEISEFAGMAHDEFGNDVSAYVKINLTLHENVTDKEYEDAHSKLLNKVAELSCIKPEYLKPISLEEYYLNNDE